MSGEGDASGRDQHDESEAIEQLTELLKQAHVIRFGTPEERIVEIHFRHLDIKNFLSGFLDFFADKFKSDLDGLEALRQLTAEFLIYLSPLEIVV